MALFAMCAVKRTHGFKNLPWLSAVGSIEEVQYGTKNCSICGSVFCRPGAGGTIHTTIADPSVEEQGSGAGRQVSGKMKRAWGDGV